MNASFRINKYLALAGVGSRRLCDRLVQDGRVRKNGHPVASPAESVTDDDVVEVDGKRVSRYKEKIYIMFYKPRGALTTARDPQGRPTVMSYLKDLPFRLFPVGRLDADSEGFLLCTNDGEAAYVLTHPRFEVEKRYRVCASGQLTRHHLERMRGGIVFKGATYRILSGSVIASHSHLTIAEVILTEGKKHEIRILFDSMDCPVLRLIRLSMGPLCLDDRLLPGSSRHLTRQEVHVLHEYIKEKKHGHHEC